MTSAPKTVKLLQFPNGILFLRLKLEVMLVFQYPRHNQVDKQRRAQGNEGRIDEAKPHL